MLAFKSHGSWRAAMRAAAALPILGAVAAALLLAMGSATAAAQQAPAEFVVNAPSAASVGGTFSVTLEITRAETTWAGYDLELDYNTQVLAVNSVTDGDVADCNPPQSWFNSTNKPTVRTGCAFQETTDTGVTETIEFECLNEGSSRLHLVTVGEVGGPGRGTKLFDPTAGNIETDLRDDTVECRTGEVPTEPAGTPEPGETPGATAPAGTPEPGTTPGSTSAPGATVPPATGTAIAIAEQTEEAANASPTPTAQQTPGADGGTANNDDGDDGVPVWIWIVVGVGAAALVAAGAAWLFIGRQGSS